MESARVTIGDKTYDARLPYEHADHLLINVTCPTCGLMHAVTEDARLVGLSLDPAKLRAAHPRGWVTAPPDPGLMAVRMMEPKRGYDRYTGKAECTRCRVVCGTMVVTFSTIFGLEEDEAVGLRCRHY